MLSHILDQVFRREGERVLATLIRQLGDFDLVALQEVDGGSLRSDYVNQVEHLAQLGNFPYWYQQLNRNLGALAQHSNGLLSRLQPSLLEDHPLPGPPGRGAILMRFGKGPGALAVVMMHLSLGARTRTRQLAYIRELVAGYRHLVLMGDMNTHANDLLERSPLRDLGLLAPQVEATFPTWRPQRCLDHILLSPSLTLETYQAIGRNAARYALGRRTTPVPVQVDNWARLRLIVKTTLLHRRETEWVRPEPPVELRFDWEPDV